MTVPQAAVNAIATRIQLLQAELEELTAFQHRLNGAGSRRAQRPAVSRQRLLKAVAATRAKRHAKRHRISDALAETRVRKALADADGHTLRSRLLRQHAKLTREQFIRTIRILRRQRMIDLRGKTSEATFKLVS